jgi:hypothetical protein
MSAQAVSTGPAPAAAPGAGSGLVPLVRAELLKGRTTRLWWGLLLVGVVIVAAFAALFAGIAGQDTGEGGPVISPSDPASLRAIYGVGFTSGYFIPLVLGIIGMTGEYRHMTITPTLLGVPRRGRLVLAKVVAYLLLGLAYGAALMLAAIVGGGLVLAARGYGLGLGAEGVPRTVALGVLGCGVWAIFGLGLGTLIRNQVVAIVAVLVFVFIAEPLLSFGLNAVSWGGNIAQFLPGSASSAIAAGTDGGQDLQRLSWWAGTLVLVAYGLVFASIGAALTTRRDVT